MSQLLFDEPRTNRLNPRGHVGRDVTGSTIAVDNPRDQAAVTANMRTKSRPPAENVRMSPAEASAADKDVTAGWYAKTLSALCDHSEYRDHVYLRGELKRLWGEIATVVATYGDSHRHMLEVYRVYREFRHQMLTHMFREEHLLFADIRRIEKSGVRPFYASGIVSGLIQVLKREHQHMRQMLERIQTLTRGYKVPPNANHTYRGVLVGLRNLETYVGRHMQNEDEFLFARAVAFEKSSNRS
jgi:regulator of cell morphogenesis and NO signaling